MKALELLKAVVSETFDTKFDNKTDKEVKEYILEAIKELEELNNRSCKSCKYSFDIFTGIDNNLLGEDFICTKLEVDKVFEKNFCCNRYEKKDSECN